VSRSVATIATASSAATRAAILRLVSLLIRDSPCATVLAADGEA
jgi:hypothetical protein